LKFFLLIAPLFFLSAENVTDSKGDGPEKKRKREVDHGCECIGPVLGAKPLAKDNAPYKKSDCAHGPLRGI
jgi:hypothetical protein